MVYLKARSASHLYKSPSTLDVSSAKLPLHQTLSAVVRYKTNSLQRHSSSWTLNSNGYHHLSKSARFGGANLTSNGGSDKDDYDECDHNDRDPLLLLTPYSKQCYLTARANKSKSMFNLNSTVAELSPNRVVTLAKKDQRTKRQILMAKHRASILWLIAKADENGRVPSEYRDPFYRDQDGQDLLKPGITQRLVNGELYGRALANIYGVPDYSCLSHQAILQLLTRRGVYNDIIAMNDICEPITETLLLKHSPVKLSAHMVIIECIMTLYIREILISVKVAEVVARFSDDFDNFDEESVADPADVALFWVNRACAQLNNEISRDCLELNEPNCPMVPTLEELSDMCDGCSLFALIAFYCPSSVHWNEIILKQDISIADSIYNLQRVQYFCADQFPSDICFLSLEDFLYLPEIIVPNFVAFIADLLFLFEIQPVKCVTLPCNRLYAESESEFQPNYPQLPTPSEMKARSLKHQSWNDSLEMNEPYYPSHHQLYDRRNSLYKTPSNTALSHPNSASRRNSLSNNNGSRILHRRSSLLSNGSEPHPNVVNAAPLMNDVDDYGMNGQVANHYSNEYEPESGTVDSVQLSPYFSSLSVSSQPNNRGVCSSSVAVESEYYKNRNRASSGHLNDYFSSLSTNNNNHHINDTLNRNNAQVRAKILHPNNTDNVKSLLSHSDSYSQHLHNHHHFNTDSHTASSDTSSIPEMSECSDDVRAKLNEKRKQIEHEMLQEREKRVSSDKSFRQEVFKTLHKIYPDSGSDADIPETNGTKAVGDKANNSKKDEEEDNSTFEIHELNPIKREKTFTSTLKSSTYVRKNLFSASDDLKASMTDLNYANAKEGSTSSSRTKLQSSDSSISIGKLLLNDTVSKPVETNKADNSISSIANNSMGSKLDLEEDKVSISNAQLSQNVSSTPVASNSVSTAASGNDSALSLSEQTPPMSTTPRRSQWGQPMLPLAAHYPQPSPPTWSQTAGSYASPDWYGSQTSPYHHLPPQAYPPSVPYPYTMGTMQAPAVPPVRPYSLHMDPHQYPAYHTPYDNKDSYMSMGYIQPAPTTAAPAGVYQQPTAAQISSTFRISKNDISAQHNGTDSCTPANTQNEQTVQKGFDVDGLLSPSKQHSNAEISVDQTQRNLNSPTAEKQHNESFFISFNDEKPLPKQTKHAAKLSQEKQPLTRTTTQTLASPSSESKPIVPKTESDDRIKQLYDVQRPNAPGAAVSFVIGVDDIKANSVKSSPMPEQVEESIDVSDDRVKREDEMTRKKELIMKQSLRRRAMQEEKRQQKEQELAAQRESERIKREQMDRKKEDERAKREFIFQQYKQRKQLEEEAEKNGGCLPVSRSSSTMVLNRAGTQQSGGVSMRPQRLLTGGRPRPKSIHSTIVAVDANSPLTSGRRLSNSRDELDFVNRLNTSSRPQSALSSQMNSAVSTPTGYSDHSFAADLAMNNTGPISSNFFSTEYNGPKLFVKPSQKSNKTLILNAINVVLAGAVNAETNRRVAEVINSCDSKYYLILFRNSGLQYRAIYSYYPEREEVTRLDGNGPRSVNNEMIDKFYKYNSGTKNFTAIQTKHLCVTIDAFTIHNHLWMTKKQQQLTPRRFA